MKRDDLKTMNLSDEQINQIMTWNGQDIENAKQNAAADEKARADRLQTQLDTLTTDLNTARSEAITAKDIKTRLEAAEAKVKAFQRTDAILNAVAAFKPKDPKMLVKLLDDEKITQAEDGTFSGINEQVEALKASSSYLFSDTPDPRGGNPDSGNGGGAFDMNAFLRS